MTLFSKDDIDMLLLELIKLREMQYRMLYFSTGSEWQQKQAKQNSLWYFKEWSGWWRLQWNQMVDHFICELQIDNSGAVSLQIESDGLLMVSSDPAFLQGCFVKYAYTQMTSIKPNQAVMELCTERSKKHIQ